MNILCFPRRAARIYEVLGDGFAGGGYIGVSGIARKLPKQAKFTLNGFLLLSNNPLH
jgi:hypothetical protein